ncbi:uncharacterized protein I303_107855 [Kwoniella dejecticola CBS 10117]|uniref:Uncharacterized protein n=1 Tax=Kwoniella dejecticola CBS 10117 TaxID=1296121 RepID=A0A1A5ZVV8_9TREE|nr:uncharacterized protein I303_07859 [Kwoniella dejecticola CBS 10117]OBR81946.1 hypothetical protein I303_07859 [Kwoniella dejecticola CBS 10117]
MAPPTPLTPTVTFALPPLPLIPTSPPLNPPILDKRQTYVTLSVTKNSTDDSSSGSSSASGFPVKIAIPALIGGMALALAGFGIWLWWTRKVKRERREAWEARQRRKRRQQQNQSGRPSVSSSTRTPPSGGGGGGGQKSPINEKGFIPPVPALPKHAATQDPYKERGYGYSGQPQSQPQQAQLQGGGAFGYSTQPSFDQPQSQYTYDQYGQPQMVSNDPRQVYGYDLTPSNEYDSNNPSNPFSNSNSAVPDLPPSQEEPPAAAAASAPPPRNEKSSKRAQARMNIADSAAANASADPSVRHQPKKPSPLALAKAAEAAQSRYDRGQEMEHLAPPGQGNGTLPAYPSGGDSGNAPGANRATSGEWGVALGSPNNDGNFPANVHQHQGYSNGAGAKDPYAAEYEGQRGKSGMYAQDPYAAYHGDGDAEQGEEDDVYHQAAAGMGMGMGTKGGNGTPKKSSRWV